MSCACVRRSFVRVVALLYLNLLISACGVGVVCCAQTTFKAPDRYFLSENKNKKKKRKFWKSKQAIGRGRGLVGCPLVQYNKIIIFIFFSVQHSFIHVVFCILSSLY